MTIMDRVGTLGPDDLRQLFLFDALDDEKLGWLAEHGWVAEQSTGEQVFTEGEPAEAFVILLSGTVALSRKVGSDDVETMRTDQVGVYMGAVQAYLRGRVDQRYLQSCRVVSDARFFVLQSEDFDVAVRTWFPMAIHLLEGLFQGLNRSQQIVAQRQQLLALGALAAGCLLYTSPSPRDS